MPKTIEIFTAGCALCQDTKALVEQGAGPDCHVTIYDLAQSCETAHCLEKAHVYGVTGLPAVVVDGKLASCCQRGPDAAILAGVLGAA